MTKAKLPEFRLQFDLSEIESLASRNENPSKVDIEGIGRAVKQQGFVSLAQLIEICRWKTPTRRNKPENNRDSDVEELTRVTFSTTNEKLRIGALNLLEGVGWPTSSVILHFCHTDRYPIIDFRALESFGIQKYSHSFALWWKYVEVCRKLSDETGCDMRTVDKALWQYSYENGQQ